jgi:hypothetical protein
MFIAISLSYLVYLAIFALAMLYVRINYSVLRKVGVYSSYVTDRFETPFSGWV